ncbi:MlaD family protein [Nocardia carnea]|uniref:MlaD family protein n=1 Tax=Nocardia carnea TaxID=37328 RepID=UPI00245402AC|nr:MlaD family protein [Nocardia carnea]
MVQRSTRVAGVLATATLTAVGGIGFAAVDSAPAPTAGFCVRMPDSVGLYEGNPVTQMGFRVGTVDHVEPRGDHVEVGFTLDGQRRFPADVQAVTRSKSILADRSLELVGNYESGPELIPGQCIPMQRSHTPKSISEIAGSAADFIAELSPGDGAQSFERAVAGFESALRGQGPDARVMMVRAAAAAHSPDRLIADIGSIILTMAPLSEETLRHWPEIQSILDQLPEVIAAGIDLWPGVIDVCVGVGWLVNVLHDVHTNYGDLLLPALRGPLAEAIHLAAGRSGDLRAMLESVPAVAAMLRQQADADGAMTVGYRPPTVRIDAPDSGAVCAALNALAPGSCTASAPGQFEMPVGSLLDLVLAKGGAAR